MPPELANRDEPIFAGDLVELNGSLPGRNWMVMAFHRDGEWAEIIRVKDVRRVPIGAEPRIVETSQLRKPSVAPQVKAVPGMIYEKRLGIRGQHGECISLHIGLIDGRVYSMGGDVRGAETFDPATMKPTPFNTFFA